MARDTLIIPYGMPRMTERAFAVERDERGAETIRCRIPHADIPAEKTTPLRFSDGGIDFHHTPPLHDLRTADEQIAYVRDYLVSRCDIYRKAQTLFIDRYADFVARIVEENAATLAARNDRFGGLYALRHWWFSAWRPLPQAHLNAPLSPGDPPYRPEEMVPVDMAFWSGTAAVAVVFAGVNSTTAKRRRDLRRLRDGGTMLVDFPETALFSDADAETAFRTLFPPEFVRFCDGKDFPSGPFRPTGLRAPPV